MEIILQILLLVAGFALLIKGADWLISGASSVAANFKISKMLVGLTIVAFGTGAPELAISLSSMTSGNTDMLLGNVIGSNIVNVLLLIGVAALIKPMRIKKDTIVKGLPILLLISTALVILFLDKDLMGDTVNAISRGDGVICLLLFCVFVYYLVATARKNRSGKKDVEKPKWKMSKSWTITIIGLIGVVIGSEMVVNGASSLAGMIGISERMIALTIVAIGTSLPELVTTITAAKKGESDIIIGNIIGSNVFNICIVLGLPIVLGGGVTLENFELLDLVVMIGSSVLLWLFTLKDHKITRIEGAAMLVLFTLYYGYIIYGALV